MRGSAETIGDEIGRDPDEVDLTTLARFSDLVERIVKRSGHRLMETLTGVLTLSKLEAGQVELSSEAVGLAAQAHWADEEGIQIVLRNLLSNAIKYTGEGGTVWVRTYREEDAAQSENAARSENAVVLEVEDTGIGMEPEVAEDLFEPFRQASEGWGREYEGTGVGLAVTKKAAEQMGGTIEVETEEGEGSRFVVRLPQAGDAGSREAD
jgi:signal transduction histidine kinase